MLPVLSWGIGVFNILEVTWVTGGGDTNNYYRGLFWGSLWEALAQLFTKVLRIAFRLIGGDLKGQHP